MIFGKAIAKKFKTFFGRIDEAEKIHVTGRDNTSVGHGLEIEDAVPVFTAVDGDQDFIGQLLRLRQGQDFKKLVEGAESAGEDHQPLGEVGEPEFAHEEVVELKIQRG